MDLNTDLDAPAGPGPDAEVQPSRPPKKRYSKVAGPIDALQIMTASDSETADAKLECLVGNDSIEDDILTELAAVAPLASPSEFAEAHRIFARAVEVYLRNSRRKPTKLPTGPLNFLIAPIVGLLVKAMAQAYVKRLMFETRRLYVMREANSAVASKEHRLLTAARRQLDQMTPTVDSSNVAIPALLLSGAALSAVASLIAELMNSLGTGIAMVAVVGVLTIGSFWCILMAAAVSRRRTKLILDQPVQMLWQVIGGAGEPPRDRSRLFVAMATILLIVGWVVAPIVVAVVAGLATGG